MDENTFLDGLSRLLKLLGMVITTVLLVAFTILLLVGDIVFGMMAWETVTTSQLVAVILEAVPNVGIIAVGMAVVWRGQSLSNISASTGVFLILAIVLGLIDAGKDAYGFWVSLSADSVMGWIGVIFVFALSAFGEVLALGLPEFLGNAVSRMQEFEFNE